MRLLVVIILIMVYGGLVGQEKYYSEPLDIPLLVTGSFAELRSSHFHSGIDFRTEGRTGLDVLSTADGYISRIVVSPFGFGHALYINHPNGTTSVYGHLSRFRDDIQEYVKNIQYKKESFKVDLQIPLGMFPLKKGELIAYSGNTGGSGGPHLHFEIRDTKTQEPINPVKLGFKIKDSMHPKFLSIMVSPLNNNSHVNYSHSPRKYRTIYYDGKYHLKNNPVIPVFENIGIAVETVDYIDGTWSKCGINYLQLLVDGKEQFSYQLECFSFDKTRYINSHIDYGEYKNSHHRYQKAWKQPGNKLGIYGEQDGILTFNDEKKHQVEIRIKDSNGNLSTLVFQVTGKVKNFKKNKHTHDMVFAYNEPFEFTTPELKLSGKPGSFYDNIEFKYDTFMDLEDSMIFSRVHQVHIPETPIHKSLELSIKPQNLPKGLETKALLATRNSKTGKLSSAGGATENGWVSSSIRNFGDYVVTIDTIPPTIKPLSIRSKKTLTEPSRIRFKISDSFSGVKSYTGTIDGKWALFEYDAKNSLITYHIDPKKLEFKKQHIINLVVVDNKNNQAEYKATFFK